MHAIKKIIYLLALLSATACTNTQTAPSMLDFSYVPPQYTGGGNAYYGLEDY